MEQLAAGRSRQTPATAFDVQEKTKSTWVENVILVHALDLGHGAQDGVERADAQRVMVGNRQPVVARGIRFQNHMAALLIDPVVTVMFAEQLD